MDMNLESCPSCGGMLSFDFRSFPMGSAKQGDKFETECPHCEEQILIGWSRNTGWSLRQLPTPSRSIRQHHPGTGLARGAVPPMMTARTP